MKINIKIIDDQNQTWVGDAILVKQNPKHSPTKKPRSLAAPKQSSKRKSYSDLILDLIDDGFFTTNKTMAEIIKELKTRDYHLKPNQMTAPLRSIVRNKHLRKTKDLQNGSKSPKWTYVKL